MNAKRKKTVRGDNMMSQKSEQFFCFLFSFVLLMTFVWPLLNFISLPSSMIETKNIYQLDKLYLSSLGVGLIFFFGYWRYLLKTTPFLRKLFFYMGCWLLLLMGKEFLVLISDRTIKVSLILLIFLLGLLLITLAFFNLKKLFRKALMK
jgi:hypothetical protein